MNTPTNDRAPSAAPEISRQERSWLAGLFLALLALRILYAWRMRFETDEAQHLHVVWAWANGLLPYRDVFDNHTPLFHLLCAPVFSLFGETAQIMIYMRLAMIPLFAISLWCVAEIGARLFSRRAGLWAAVFAGFMPLFFLKTVEFRTDDLWTTLCLATLATAVGGPLTARRMFGVGLALGATFSVSLKTTVLALALLLAGVATLVLWRRNQGELRASAVLGGLGAGLAGLLVVPTGIVAYFAAQHALGLLYDCTIAHNLLPAKTHSHDAVPRHYLFPATLPILVGAAWFVFRRTTDRSRAAAQALVLLTTGFFLTLLHSYWTVITNQDYLPVTPLLVMLLTPGVLALAESATTRFPRLPRLAVPLALTFAELCVTVKVIKPRERTGEFLEMIAAVLHYTDRGDYVMDAKSGAIFRRRPYYYALEHLTVARTKRGLIDDDIVGRLIATRTCVAFEDRLRGRNLTFVRANYLPEEHGFRIAGQYLSFAANGRAAFEIQIAAPYGIVTPQGPASGMLDGKPLIGKVMLEAGPHEFFGDQPGQPHALVWAQALERGFKPNFSP